MVNSSGYPSKENEYHSVACTLEDKLSCCYLIVDIRSFSKLTVPYQVEMTEKLEPS